MPTAYLSLGSNLGHREATLRQAVRALEQRCGVLLKCSAFIETEAWGFESNHRFLNAAVALRTTLTPAELLAATQDIERQLGRTEKSRAGCYADRIIDIDILFYDDVVLFSKTLTLPHPLLHKRLFVLQPLAEIAPQFVHPVLQRDVRTLLEEARHVDVGCAEGATKEESDRRHVASDMS